MIFVHFVTEEERDRNSAQFPRGNQNVTNSLTNTFLTRQDETKKLKCFWPFQICNVGHYITKEYICRLITFDVENKWKKWSESWSLILAWKKEGFSARDVFLTMAIEPEQ